MGQERLNISIKCSRISPGFKSHFKENIVSIQRQMVSLFSRSPPAPHASPNVFRLQKKDSISRRRMPAPGWLTDVWSYTTCVQVLASFKIYILLFSGMVRTTVQQICVTERMVCYSLFPRVGNTPFHMRSHTRDTRFSQEGNSYEHK